MRHVLSSLLAVAVLIGLSSCTHIEWEVNAAGGGTLEDAILITSPGGAAPREVTVLGDIDLSVANGLFNKDLDATTSTHWWLIGHLGGDVVYSSGTNLGGVDLHDVEPYDVVGPLDWNIPANLDGYANGTGYSFDWWAQTVNNHSSHVVPDGNSATLWRFGTTGWSIGTITFDLHVDN